MRGAPDHQDEKRKKERYSGVRLNFLSSYFYTEQCKHGRPKTIEPNLG